MSEGKKKALNENSYILENYKRTVQQQVSSASCQYYQPLVETKI